MNACVILFRMNGGPVEAVRTQGGGLHVFTDRDDAISFLDDHWRMWRSGYVDTQIVELDEL